MSGETVMSGSGGSISLLLCRISTTRRAGLYVRTAINRRKAHGSHQGCSADLLPTALEEFLHLREETLPLRAALAVAQRFRLELLHQLPLPARQVLRGFHRDLDIHVAARRAPQHREALAAQAELIAGLRAR